MFKKLLIVAVIGGAAVYALKHTRIGSYAKEEISSVGEWVDSKVPTEKKIKQLRKEIAALDKEVERAGNELAREIVEVDYLTTDISRETVALATEEKKVRALAEQIRAATENVAYGRAVVPVNEAKQLLAGDVKRLQNRKETLGVMNETLVARERMKDALQKQVEAIKQQKRELTAAVDHLEADYKRLQLQQIESKYQFDDSKLASVKQQLKNLQKDIDIKRTKLNLAPTVASESTGAPATALSVDEIMAPLTGTAKSEKKSN